MLIALLTLTMLTADGGEAIDSGIDDAGPADAGADAGIPPVVFNFDSEDAGVPPRGMLFRREGKLNPGHWLVQAEVDAPSPPNVVAQVDAHAGERSPMALIDS